MQSDSKKNRYCIALSWDIGENKRIRRVISGVTKRRILYSFGYCWNCCFQKEITSKTIVNSNIFDKQSMKVMKREVPMDCNKFGFTRFTKTVSRYSEIRTKIWNEIQVNSRSFQFDLYKNVRQKLVIRLNKDVIVAERAESNVTNR